MNDCNYDSIKLNLADVIRGLMLFARRREHTVNAGHAQQLLAKLAEDRFQLAVVGRFNAGKSSLMNAVLGERLLPTGIRPLTSVITTVAYGSRPALEVVFRDRPLPVYAPVEHIARYVTEDGNPANEKEVQSVIVRAPLEPLRKGFHFVDTPGIGSDIVANTAATERFLPDADAVVFVTSFDAAMCLEEWEFLARVRQHAGKIFYVVNKLDLVEPSERSASLGELARRIGERSGGSSVVRVFAVSARDALEAKLSGGREILAASGLLEFETTLWKFLTDGKCREFLNRVAARAESILGDERYYLEISQAGRRHADEFETRVRELSTRSKSLQACAREQVRSALPAAIQSDLNQWSEQTIDQLRGRGELLKAEYIREAIVERWGVWVKHQERSLVSTVLDVAIAGTEIREIWSLPCVLKQSAAEIFGVANAAGIDLAPDLLERVRVAFAAAPDLAIESVHAGWSFRRGTRVGAVERSVAAYTQILRSRTVEAALDWMGRLFRECDMAYEAEAASIRSALEWGAAEADRQVLRRLNTALRKVRDALQSKWDPARPHSDGSGSGKPRGKPCRICAFIAKELFAFLSKEQYILATDDQHQAEHARGGAFCTLHAWQYESIASPQGLCLAYAPLLEKRARDLLGAVESELPDLLQAVERAVPASYTCRICQLISEWEQAIARELASRLARGGRTDAVGLCIPHLGTVLRSGVPAQVARSVVQSHAEALQSCARDMRFYALKHDAIRRELVTEEERMAYYRGLAWVAGARAIALPWKPTH